MPNLLERINSKTIKAEKKDSQASMNFKDTGSGIQSEIIPKLFSKFVTSSRFKATQVVVGYFMRNTVDYVVTKVVLNAVVSEKLNAAVKKIDNVNSIFIGMGS